jgi:excisionase family DNA binding protein
MYEEDAQALEQRVEAVLERLLLPVMDMVRKRLEMPPQEWFSIEETAALTGLSPKHIRRAIKRRQLQCSNVGGEKRPTYRIARNQIEAWMAANVVKQAPPKSERDELVEKYFKRRRRAAG